MSVCGCGVVSSSLHAAVFRSSGRRGNEERQKEGMSVSCPPLFAGYGNRSIATACAYNYAQGSGVLCTRHFDLTLHTPYMSR